MTNQKKIAIAISAALIGVAAGTLFVYTIANKQQSEQPASIEVTESTETTEVVISTETVPETTEAPELTDRAKELLAENPDTVGWITIENTNVDNPIVQCTDNAYYLDHDFHGEPFRAGTVFMDYRDVFSYDETAQSENIILYGHNMANNTMFGSLRRYRQDYSYYKRALFITLESNYTSYEYVIFGLVITEGSANASWRYWVMENLSMKPNFDAYVETVRQKSLTEIPVDVQYGDKLLTLSTCYSDKDDSRFLVVARRLRPDETREDFSALME
ncbi:MAG: class B sortase [Oscillospiraceae bacterium]|nr:class B sortase [Oscillospiraceae bacterium]